MGSGLGAVHKGVFRCGEIGSLIGIEDLINVIQCLKGGGCSFYPLRLSPSAPASAANFDQQLLFVSTEWRLGVKQQFSMATGWQSYLSNTKTIQIPV